MDHRICGRYMALVLAALCAVCTAEAQNLVDNGDFSAGNTGFSTDYQFVATGLSFWPGTYGIRTNSRNFNTDFTSFGDHTSGAGYMMLVDGRDPSWTVWAENVSVNPGHHYTFSVWYAVAPPAQYNSPAILRFAINGSEVGLIDIGTDAGVWRQFSAEWAAGDSTSARLQINDMNPVPFVAGNDFALDDISFLPSGPSTPVPEPGSLALALVGCVPCTLRSFMRRRKQTRIRHAEKCAPDSVAISVQ